MTKKEYYNGILMAAMDNREVVTASLLSDVAIMLTNAFIASKLTVAQLADELGVSEDRVHQIIPLGSDSNLMGDIRLSTFARYMDAMGARIDCKEFSHDSRGDVNLLPKRRRERRTEDATVTLDSLTYDILDSMAGDHGFPLADFMAHTKFHGFKPKQVIEFLADESLSDRLRISDDSTLLAIK